MLYIAHIYYGVDGVQWVWSEWLYICLILAEMVAVCHNHPSATSLRRWCFQRPYCTYEHLQTTPIDLYYITIDCVSVFCEVIDSIGDEYRVEDGSILPIFHKKQQHQMTWIWSVYKEMKTLWSPSNVKLLLVKDSVAFEWFILSTEWLKCWLSSRSA